MQNTEKGLQAEALPSGRGEPAPPRGSLLASASGRVAILFGLSILLVSITRWPLIPAHLFSFDSVNLSLALREFDPTRNQPQPPGYPFFVIEARLVQSLFGTPERTFMILGIVVCGLAVGMLYLLGKRMFSSCIGAAAAALLFVNPPFWFSGLTSPLRPHMALISILVAYCCWRACCGEGRYFEWASLVLGVGGGFRPELLWFLFPLWVWTAWHCRQMPRLIRGGLLLGLATIAWLAVLAMASGGIMRMLLSFSEYLYTQTSDTSLLLNPADSWRRTAGRAIVWTGLGTVPWLWTLPFGWLERRSWQDSSGRLAFLSLWFLPGFLFHFAVHIADPDHALSTIPALCLLGGVCLWSAEQALSRRWLPELNGSGYLVWIVLVGNLVLFFGQFPIPQRDAAGSFRGWSSVSDATLIGTYESSYARVRWIEQMTDLGLIEIGRLKSSTQRPVLIVWARDGEPVWRKICYYLPSEKVLVLEEKNDPGIVASAARLWSGNYPLAEYQGTSPIRVPIPKDSRLIWVIGSNQADSLKQVISLQSSSSLYYTDLAADAQPFRWKSFEFVPE